MDAKRLAALRESFAAFEGTWEGEEVVSPSAQAPAVGARGRHVMRRAVDGTVLLQEYEQRRPGGAAPLAGHGVFAVDAADGGFVWFFFDSLGFLPTTPARGGWRGGELVFARATRRGEAYYRFRADGKRLLHRIESKLAGAADFSLFLSGTYARTS